MGEIIASSTLDMSLGDVLSRLSQSDLVSGVLQIGSLSRGQVKDESDYDLVIVLEQAAAPWYVGVTTIDRRFTDLIFVDKVEVERFLDLNTTLAHDHPLTPIIRWFREGEILHARSPAIIQAQEKARNNQWIEKISDDAAYGAWFRINYNLAQARRILGSDDAVYRQTLGIRMSVYGPSDLWFGYFTIRKLDWDGDKAAVRYLENHDPEFLDTFQTFLVSSQLFGGRWGFASVRSTLANPPPSFLRRYHFWMLNRRSKI